MNYQVDRYVFDDSLILTSATFFIRYYYKQIQLFHQIYLYMNTFILEDDELFHVMKDIVLSFPMVKRALHGADNGGSLNIDN